MDYVLTNQEKGKETEIVFGPDAFQNLSALAGNYTKTVVIADENSAKFCYESVKSSLPDGVEIIILPVGEANKNLGSAEGILHQLQELGCDRKSLVVGLGGGVISDLVGFVASTYMRGINWVMLPTTLIAQADAAIGAKTGVNLGGYKNMVGSFWPPKAVLINPEFLKTLPKEQLRNGLAEIIKMGFIADSSILEHVKNINPDELLGEDLTRATQLAVKAKVDIVNNDMLENGERKLLNFGHTIGHALESISLDTDQSLLHGEAVSIGMVAEAKLAELERVCQPGILNQVKETLECFGLPVSYKQASVDNVSERIASDKKNVGDNIHWTLPKDLGQGTYDNIASPENIKTAIKSVLG